MKRVMFEKPYSLNCFLKFLMLNFVAHFICFITFTGTQLPTSFMSFRALDKVLVGLLSVVVELLSCQPRVTVTSCFVY